MDLSTLTVQKCQRGCELAGGGQALPHLVHYNHGVVQSCSTVHSPLRWCKMGDRGFRISTHYTINPFGPSAGCVSLLCHLRINKESCSIICPRSSLADTSTPGLNSPGDTSTPDLSLGNGLGCLEVLKKEKKYLAPFSGFYTSSTLQYFRHWDLNLQQLKLVLS